MLTDLDRRMLDFERAWWRFPGAKEETIRAEFGMSATRYYQRLNALVEDSEAAAYSPGVVNRLRRLKDKRRDSSRGLGFDRQ